MDLATALRECSADECYRETYMRIAEIKDYNSHALDGLWSELRTQKGRYLQNGDLEAIFSPDKTHYGYYWKAPSGVNLDGISLYEADRGITDKEVQQWRHHMVQRLFGGLKSMEVTSVVLSCLYPKDFGVYSPPTLMILQIPPRPPVQHYLAYCEELAAWGRHFLNSDGARTMDRALWAFYEAAYGHKKTPKAETYRTAFDTDKWVRERHAQSVLKPHFPKWLPLEQARFLIDIDRNLAGMIAGCEFEARIKELVDHGKAVRDQKIRRFKPTLPAKPNRAEWGHLEAMVEYVIAQNKTDYGSERDNFQKIRELRNVAIHDERLLERKEIELMIEATGKLPQGRELQRLH